MTLRINFLIFLIALTFVGFSAQAKKDDEFMAEPTPTHIVGFTFHKLAGSEPNYSKWAEVYLNGKLKEYGEEGKKEKIRSTKARFRTNFKNFLNKNVDEITIILPARLEIVPFEGRYLMNITVGAGLDFIIKQTPEFLINLVVPDLEEKLKPVVSSEDVKDIKKAAGMQFEKPEHVNLVLKLRPVSVDASEPITIKGKEYWLMLMEFSTYELWHPKGYRHYWDYTTEEQKQQKLNELRALYKDEDEEANDEVQVIEPLPFE